MAGSITAFVLINCLWVGNYSQRWTSSAVDYFL